MRLCGLNAHTSHTRAVAHHFAKRDMRIKLISIIILTIQFLGNSQIDNSIDIITGIEYSHRNLSSLNNDASSLGVIERRNSVESGKSNWRFGLNYNHKLSNKIFLKSGIRLISIGYKGEKQTDLRWPSEIDPNFGWVLDPTLPHEIQLTYDYWFIELPFATRFEVNNNKLSPFVEIGISPSLYLTTRIKELTDIGTETKFQTSDQTNFNEIHAVGFISIGLNYLITEIYQIFFQPTFRYHFTELFDTSISENLYNYGVEIGIRRKI